MKGNATADHRPRPHTRARHHQPLHPHRTLRLRDGQRKVTPSTTQPSGPSTPLVARPGSPPEGLQITSGSFPAIMRGRCWRRSPTTCSAPQAPSPGGPTRSPAEPTLRRHLVPAPGRTNPAPTRSLAPGPTTGKPCGTASSSTAADKSWTETLTTRPKATAGNDSGHAGHASRSTMPVANSTRQDTPPNRTKINKSADPLIQA